MDRSTASRPTGIPRLSRLPIPHKTSSRSQLSPSSPSNLDGYRPTAATPKLQKRASEASLNRAAQSISRDPSPVKTIQEPRSSGLAASRYGSKAPTGTLKGLNHPSSRSNQPRAPLPSSRPTNGDHEETDQLGALNGFRTASRQGFHDDASPVEYVESVQTPDEELLRPADRTKSRPSLSDRTIESLQHVPSTPNDRRRSSFFSPVESPMGPPARPGSAMSRNGSTSSRPGTSDGTSYFKPVKAASPAKRAPASAKPASRIASSSFGFTSASGTRRSVSTAHSSEFRNGLGEAQAPPRSPSPVKPGPSSISSATKPTARPPLGSKTLAARSSKPRPALADAFGAPHPAGIAKGISSFAKHDKLASPKRVTSNPTNNSSAALREQIAAAKAAVRKDKIKHDSPQQHNNAQLEDFATATQGDPFNQVRIDPKHLLRNKIKSAWTTGKLHIAGLELKQIPDEVVGMFDAKAMADGKVNWAEVVDLTKLNAADNEIEVLDDVLFPDKSAEAMDEDEDGKGNTFGGLEALDLHGNMLQTVPVGLRRLERLTTLNLSHNKLDNQCLDIIAQIPRLKHLNLGHNSLSGSLPTIICGLPQLETLDLQSNRLLGLPDALRDLTTLRILNVAGNQLTALPMQALQQISLLHLDASSNMLIGSLFPLGNNTTNAHPTLQSLNLSNNSIAALTFSPHLGFPSLRTLNVTNNHLTTLPDLSSWHELTELMAADNKIAEVPPGFTLLRKLRIANFTNNEIRALDPEIARMGALETLVLAANPLREKKFLTISAAAIKDSLAAKLEPVLNDEEGEVSDPETVIGIKNGSASDIWQVTPRGTLDLSSSHLSDSSNDRLGSLLQTTRTELSSLNLRGNSLTHVPPCLWLAQDLQILDLSHNSLFDGRGYFSAELEFPVLQELNLSFCRLETLEPLVASLVAPKLRRLDISGNNLTGPVPALRDTFPTLTTLLAKDDHFSSISFPVLKGLHTVDLTGNEIAALPAELGLLWDEGLRHCEVAGNPFRVPGRAILGKGTEGLLRWLRGRIVGGVEELD
ncbi:hypothetical protein LTR62_001653 [Meristemomyces frigidus]|uniref:L domain-like protein n=1 Tax=Meristemomyces frigidus TaxID=1508187 RepID=A0AAN7YMA9_9PEZI|nr:hypothetical protein LTR62_001653 [Meristemomyces frigidus]